MAAPYIPTRDSILDSWANNFSSLISATPALYGLTPAEASTIAVEVAAWNIAYPLAIDPPTRTSVTVSAKNAAKIAMTTIIRTFASQIRLNPGVTDSDKLALGLNLPNNSPSPIPPPPTFPLLSVALAGPLVHEMRFADNTTPSLRAKPQNAVALELWGVVGSAPIVDPTLMTKLLSMTKQPINVVWQSGDAGKTASYIGRWINRKGEAGPWGAPISFTVAT